MHKVKAFVNTRYSKEWKQGEGYENGSIAVNEDGSYTVYDGGQNYMGKIMADGEVVCKGSSIEYKMSFIDSAKDALGLA